MTRDQVVDSHKEGVRRLRRALIAVLLIAALFCPSVVRAEASGSTYMERGLREAYHNMHLVYKAYFDDQGQLEVQPGGYVAYEQEWDENGNLISRTYLGPDGRPVNRSDGYAKAEWSQNKNGTWILAFQDVEGRQVDDITGLNLVRLSIDIDDDGWSDWMKPVYDKENSCMTIATVNLGDKKAGDTYTCRIEVEVKDVQATEGMAFWFRSQGSADGAWDIGNVWNDGLINEREPLSDGIHTFTVTSQVNEKMVGVSRFDIGFRCDYWMSGMFRVRNVKIEKGDTATEWTPGL